GATWELHQCSGAHHPRHLRVSCCEDRHVWRHVLLPAPGAVPGEAGQGGHRRRERRGQRTAAGSAWRGGEAAGGEEHVPGQPAHRHSHLLRSGRHRAHERGPALRHRLRLPDDAWRGDALRRALRRRVPEAQAQQVPLQRHSVLCHWHRPGWVCQHHGRGDHALVCASGPPRGQPARHRLWHAADHHVAMRAGRPAHLRGPFHGQHGGAAPEDCGFRGRVWLLGHDPGAHARGPVPARQGGPGHPRGLPGHTVHAMAHPLHPGGGAAGPGRPAGPQHLRHVRDGPLRRRLPHSAGNHAHAGGVAGGPSALLHPPGPGPPGRVLERLLLDPGHRLRGAGGGDSGVRPRRRRGDRGGGPAGRILGRAAALARRHRRGGHARVPPHRHAHRHPHLQQPQVHHEHLRLLHAQLHGSQCGLPAQGHPSEQRRHR
ncbi:hypothetical protein APUTEX25_000858, partial [Auxenochlorella protothecoides]